MDSERQTPLEAIICSHGPVPLGIRNNHLKISLHFPCLPGIGINSVCVTCLGFYENKLAPDTRYQLSTFMCAIQYVYLHS